MANYKEILIKYGAFIELGAYLITFISIFLPFKHMTTEEEMKAARSKYDKRKDLSPEDYSEALKYDAMSGNISGNRSYISFASGGWVLAFTIISIILVLVGTFAKSFVESLKNDNKNYEKIIDGIFEYVPISLSVLSFLITIISSGNGELGKLSEEDGRPIKVSVGFFFVLIGLLVAIAARVAYFVLVKKPDFLNREVKAEKTGQTTNEFVVPVN